MTTEHRNRRGYGGGVSGGSHFVAWFDIELDLLAGECTDPVKQSMVSATVSLCSRAMADDAIRGAR